MRPTIVIGTDGSAQADSALDFGAAIARALGARVIVANAYFHTPPLRGDRGTYDAIMHDDAAEIAGKGAAEVEGVTEVRARAVSGPSIPEALHHVAEVENADLLVIATSARRRIAGHQPGSIAERVAHQSPCSVAVVPPNAGEPRFERIGVAVDGTPAARTALEFASLLADRAGGESPYLRLMHVSPVPAVFGHVPQPGAQPPPTRPVFDRRGLEALAATAREHCEVDVEERAGAPAAELMRMSEGVDVLVTGSRDQGAVKRLLLGSVSTHIVRHATCPVVVVPTVTGITSGWTHDSARTVGA
jgi:nucleotide-binding universal stress UspA family protein